MLAGLRAYLASWTHLSQSNLSYSCRNAGESVEDQDKKEDFRSNSKANVLSTNRGFLIEISFDSQANC